MKMKKLLTAILCTLMFMGIMSFNTITVYAVEESEDTKDDGLVLNKTAKYNPETDDYSITLEAYATGEKITTGVTTDVATDIVLVLDQSGSMDWSLDNGSDVSYSKVNNKDIDIAKSYYIRIKPFWLLDYYEYYEYYEVYYCTECNEWYRTRTHAQHTNSTSYNPSYSSFYQTVLNNNSKITTTTRLSALKTAVYTFVNNVITSSKGEDLTNPDDDLDHRIAIVGFSSDDETELMSINGSNSNIPGTNNNQLGVKYSDSLNDKNYVNVLNDMTNNESQTLVLSAVDALVANGATNTDDGLQMAYNILSKNNNSDRKKVVILFTDGSPTSGNGFEKSVAENGIKIANNIKTEFGATVYSVGVFSGANADERGKEPDRDLAQGSGDLPAASNWFMQQVSSNDGKPQKPSYYLSAKDTTTLNDIFKQLSEQINGGSRTKLDSNTVIRDIISPQFQLLENSTTQDVEIKVQKYNQNGTFSDNTEFDTKSIKINIDENTNTLSVTGFDFSENWCGIDKNTITNEETAHGNKLIFSFKVRPKDGFLGGNNVYTNTSAKVYKNQEDIDADSEENPTFIKEFNKPQVNVPIKDISITPSDKNVYLLGSLTGEQLKEHSIVKCGNVTLDLTNKDNYGLESWQTDYVNITTTVKDLKGAPVTDRISGLEVDTTYSIEVTIAPKYDGIGASGDPVKQQRNFGQGNINVYKPFVTVSDSIAYYGDTAPTDFSSNRTIVWKHDNNVADEKNMGNAPDLSLKYDHVGTDVISNGKINTKNDIPVDITSKIGDVDVTKYTIFTHTDCKDITDAVLDNHQFWIHVKTCKLTIRKKGGSVDETYVFKIKKDDSDYTEVSITGNGTVVIDELPVGKYTVEEDTAWSWRYPNPKITYSGTNQSATLSSTKPTDTASVTNMRESQNWLNGFSTVVQNIFGKANN